MALEITQNQQLPVPKAGCILEQDSESKPEAQSATYLDF